MSSHWQPRPHLRKYYRMRLAATTHGYRDSRTGPQQREWRNYRKKAWRERAELGL